MRTFIAIKIPDEIKKELVVFQSSLKSDVQEVRWVKSENLHLTLKFLGQISEEEVKKVSQKIVSSISGIHSFIISFSGIGGFPNIRRPKVLWIGIDKGKEKVIEIMNLLNKGLAEFREEERNPIPHLTLGRIKRVQTLSLKERKFETASFHVDRLYLIKSDLTPSGPKYTDIKEFNFQS